MHLCRLPARHDARSYFFGHNRSRCAWFAGYHVSSFSDLSWVYEVFAQMRDVLEEFKLMTERHMVKQAQVLRKLTHVANVWYYA